MRLLFLFLLLLNLAFFAWEYSHPETPPPAPPPETEPGIAPLVLLSERSAVPPAPSTSAAPVAVPADTARAKTAVATPVPVQHPDACYIIGPFEARTQAQRVMHRLNGLGFPARLRTQTRRVPGDYWVYLPPLPSRQAALQRVHALAGRGMKNYFIVTSGEQQNAISLGVFKDKASAERRKAQVAAMGYTPVLGRRPTERSVYWLDYGETPDHMLAPSVWSAIAKGLDIQRKPRPCG
ncbi:MAG: SPOR domain-containing protein [Gammaproteobacteria bacterium]|nr:SPOR domain-containing protein [Gammaproteobacteria bacterium]